MKKQIFAAVFAALMTGVPYAAYAQEAPPPPGPGGMMMMRADANHDGVITREEMLADVDQRFARMDTNHDGKIDQAERDAARAAMMARRGGEGGEGRGMGRRMDGNGDGTITLDEQHAQANRRFDMMDTNHDGKIDQAERDAMRERMMQMRGPDGRQGPPPADAPPPPNGN